MRNVSDKSCKGNQNTHFVFNNFFFFENRAVYEIMWETIVERGRPIWRMSITCWIPNATNTHTGYVTLNAFPLQQRLHKRASMLRYKHICLSVSTPCSYHSVACVTSHRVTKGSTWPSSSKHVTAFLNCSAGNR